MNSVGFIRTEYLILPEIFLYNEITSLKKFNPVVLTHETHNLDVFPHQPVITLNIWADELALRKGFSLGRPISTLKKLRHYLKAKRYFHDIIQKHNIRILHAEFGPEGVYGLFIKESFGLPLVTSFRGYDLYLEPVRNPGIYDELFEKGDLFLFRSKSMLKDAVKIGCPNDRSRVHHTSLDLNRLPYAARKLPSKRKPIKLLSVGRFVEKKAPLLAVEVFSKLCETRENLEFTMVGGGPLFEETKGMVKKCGLEGKVHLPGFVPYADVVSEMLSSHIFFMPFQTASDGDKEGIPNSLKEASATGMPVVSTFHSGITEAVIDGKTGLLASEGDVEGLVDKLSYLIENQDLWGQFGMAGRELMEEEFDIIKETEKLEGFYSELLGE